MLPNVKLFKVSNYCGKHEAYDGVNIIIPQTVLLYKYPILNPEVLKDLQKSKFCLNVLIIYGNLTNGEFLISPEPPTVERRFEKAVVWVQLIKTVFFSSYLTISEGIITTFEKNLEGASNSVVEVPIGSSFTVKTSYKEELKKPDLVCTYTFDGKSIIAQ